jgi:hypothetical protein
MIVDIILQNANGTEKTLFQNIELKEGLKFVFRLPRVLTYNDHIVIAPVDLKAKVSFSVHKKNNTEFNQHR